jgi:hypothetical protein
MVVSPGQQGGFSCAWLTLDPKEIVFTRQPSFKLFV